jgi:Nucleotidyltransferase domain
MLRGERPTDQRDVTMGTAGNLAEAVPRLLRAVPGVVRTALCGSRERGDAGPLSDWDFVVETDDFAATAAVLPTALDPLDPLAAQWDRLSRTACFMLIVPGPEKVDLIFEDVPHGAEPPWTVTSTTLGAVDAHFWDWTLWLASKVDAAEVVDTELGKMHEHLLGPLEADQPTSLGHAVHLYLQAAARWEERLGVTVDKALRVAVLPIVGSDP